jgi:hypothetical protein
MGAAEISATSGKGILFLDELTAAPQITQTGRYQLVLDRKLGEYQLPEGCWRWPQAIQRCFMMPTPHRPLMLLPNAQNPSNSRSLGPSWTPNLSVTAMPKCRALRH